jgi:formylglycine-generating enzyme
MLEADDAELSSQSAGAANKRMQFIPGGTFRMGSDRHYPEEAPCIA